MKIDFEKLRQAADLNSLLPPGGYVCKIFKVEDIQDKQCLKIYYDVVEGEYENYFSQTCELDSFYPGVFHACYKNSALIYFARFISAVEESNADYTFQGDEKELEGKFIGLVLREEEYLNKSKNKETKLGVSEYLSVDTIRNGDFEVPDKKTLR